MKRQGKLYSAWFGMNQRCFNKKNKQYANYGGRGIRVVERWWIFENFVADMGEPPSHVYSLDRKDNNGNYKPDNCRWATQTEQNLNKRLSRTNTSGAVGVTWLKSRSKWRAEGEAYGKRYHLYIGDSFEDAVAARTAWQSTYN